MINARAETIRHHDWSTFKAGKHLREPWMPSNGGRFPVGSIVLWWVRIELRSTLRGSAWLTGAAGEEGTCRTTHSGKAKPSLSPELRLASARHWLSS